MIKILITGDFCPHERIEQLIMNNRFDEIFNDLFPFLENNDINITNLECPIADYKSPIQKIGPNLLVKNESVKALNYGKFNLVTLSNNHIMDQGEDGLLSTFQLLKKNKIEHIGAGRNLKEACEVFYKDIKNSRFAFLNFSENEFSTATLNSAGSNPLNPVKNYYKIKSAREKADYVIIIVHGGNEGYSLPSPRVVDTYRFFVDSGADIVVGHHTHCISGYERYKEGLIFYSLGNFIFDWKGIRNSEWNYGYALKLFFNEKEISFSILPYKQCDDNPGVFLLKEKEKQEFDDKLKKLCIPLSEESMLQNEWNIFSQKAKKSYLVNFEAFNSEIYKSLRHRKLIPGFLSDKKRMLLLNLIRCESHRDLLIESLK